MSSCDTTLWKISFSLAFIGMLTCAEVSGQHLIINGHKIWYKYLNQSASTTPIIFLHGGPGMTSFYLEPFEALSHSFPILLYDQLGCGRSDVPTDTSSYLVSYYVEELEQIRSKLGIDHFYLFGHSWGGFLALSYIEKYPDRVKKLILAGPLVDVNQWLRDANDLRAQLPDSTQRVLAVHEEAGTISSEAYLRATQQFYGRYLLRKSHPLADTAFKYMGYEVYNHMWGPTEFRCTGNLKGMDNTAVLTRLEIPVLFTAGRFDECRPETLRAYARKVRDSQLHIFELGSHMTMLEQPEESLKVLSSFLIN